MPVPLRPAESKVFMVGFILSILLPPTWGVLAFCLFRASHHTLGAFGASDTVACVTSCVLWDGE